MLLVFYLLVVLLFVLLCFRVCLDWLACWLVSCVDSGFDVCYLNDCFDCFCWFVG